jgi:DNA-directed RNA polymerase subunit RPC12/RpoP
MPRITIAVDGFRCARCGHEWIPRKHGDPVVCPKCKSPFWDRERWLTPFRVEAILRWRDRVPTAKQLEALERRLGLARRPTVRSSGTEIRIGIDLKGANEANARSTASRVVHAAIKAVGIASPGSTFEIRSVTPVTPS